MENVFACGINVLNGNMKQLSIRWMYVFVGLLTAFPAFSTDIYLPALPSMGDEFQTTMSLANQTLVLFFTFLSISTLLWGPLSDRFGRKPVLLIGTGIYLISSLMCAVSTTIYQLIVFRVFQAIGSGAATAVSVALVRDYFPLEHREKAFAVVGVIMGVVPVIAPVIGGQLLRFTSWRGNFIALSIVGFIALAFSFRIKETNLDKSSDSVPVAWMRLFVVLKNRSFRLLLVIFSSMTMPLLAFIGSSSAIYIKGFGLSEQVYSLFFASGAIAGILGAPTYLFLAKHINGLKVLSLGYIMTILSGFLIALIGGNHPVIFAVSVAIGGIATTMLRPPSNILLLEQQDRDTGTASSLITSSNFFVGSLGMFIVSLGWQNRILILGALYVVIGTGCFILWGYARKQCRIPAIFQEK